VTRDCCDNGLLAQLCGGMAGKYLHTSHIRSSILPFLLGVLSAGVVSMNSKPQLLLDSQ
jgi:hypothetical protein